jgi:adenylosuccinate lyase
MGGSQSGDGRGSDGSDGSDGRGSDGSDALGGGGGGNGEAAYSATEWRLRALSPLDGRYGRQMERYAAAFSEAALIRQRVVVELAWLRYLAALPGVVELGPLTAGELEALDRWVADFGTEDAMAVKQAEARTNHDVKAVEYYLKQRVVDELGWSVARAEFVHFGATSEDINNLAYARMVREALGGAWLPAADALVEDVRRMALEHATQPMLAHTHGQPATPTTLGKELAVFVARWERQLRSARAVDIPGKWGGATGTLAAHCVAYPELDWMAITSDFVASMGFSWAPLTTQVEPHDWLAELFAAMARFGTILVDFCQDMWYYTSLGYLRLKVVGGEVGSSVMPHKLNPIDFENAEANAGLAAALLGHLGQKLPISRMQRDLSDSSALRNIGSAFGYSGLAISSARRGLARSSPDPDALAAGLDHAWEVLTEAVQTLMRRYGLVGGYERLKALSHGKALTAEEINHFVRELDLPPEAQERLSTLTPSTYTGLAGQLAKLVDVPGTQPGP